VLPFLTPSDISVRGLTDVQRNSVECHWLVSIVFRYYFLGGSVTDAISFVRSSIYVFRSCVFMLVCQFSSSFVSFFVTSVCSV